MASPSGFQKLISFLPRNFKVLDVGCGGLQGENTTNYLTEHFEPKNITGICNSDHEVKRFQALRVEAKLQELNIISTDFYKDVLSHDPFDLAVLDLNIENNLLQDWSVEGLKRMELFVKPGGYLINYVMLTNQYGDPTKTPSLISQHWRDFWGTEKLQLRNIGERLSRINSWELFAYELEERRKYILWVMLKRTSGS